MLQAVKIGVIGCGYWGARHIRNFNDIPEAALVGVSDLNQARLAQISETYPNVRTTSDFRELLDSDVEGVVIATPPTTHYPVAEAALLRGKHVLVEKPLTVTSTEALDLVRLAESRGLVLMVGYTYYFNPAVDYLREMIDRGEMGDVLYIDAARLNLGLFQPDVDVLWDLAPHDLSILMMLLGKDPLSVSARGAAHVNPRLADVAYLELRFPDDILAHVHVSWLDPCKVRRVTVVGSKKMVVFDDVSESEKIRIYDKGVNKSNGDSSPAWPVTYRNGNVTIPFIPNTEPLKLECTHFVQCIAKGQKARCDGWAGLKVVSILEAARTSLLNGGTRQSLAPLEGVGAVHSGG